MNAIIWWLESPWQLRALVFILSFFVCFVGPWLHSQSVLTSRIAARKPLDEKSETVSAPKAEGALQQAEAQAKVPASQEQIPAQEKAPLQAATAAAAEQKSLAQHEPVHPQTEGPVHVAQLPEEVPVREEQASAPVDATPVPVATLPGEEKAPVQREEVRSSPSPG